MSHPGTRIALSTMNIGSHAADLQAWEPALLPNLVLLSLQGRSILRTCFDDVLDELQSALEVFGVGGLPDRERRVRTPIPRSIDKPCPRWIQGGFGPLSPG